MTAAAVARMAAGLARARAAVAADLDRMAAAVADLQVAARRYC